jgi:hypothetical protein
MNAIVTQRMSVMIGLTLASVIAVWWLGSTRLAMVRTADSGRAAVDALYALLVVRGMVLAVLSVRLGTLRGWRIAVTAGLAVIAMSWPLVLLAWSASTAAFSIVLLGEALLAGAAAVLPVAGAGLRQWLRRPELASVVGTAIGVALIAAMWFYQGEWLHVLSPNLQ